MAWQDRTTKKGRMARPPWRLIGHGVREGDHGSAVPGCVSCQQLLHFPIHMITILTHPARWHSGYPVVQPVPEVFHVRHVSHRLDSPGPGQRSSSTGTVALRITTVVVLPTRKRRITEWP